MRKIYVTNDILKYKFALGKESKYNNPMLRPILNMDDKLYTYELSCALRSKSFLLLKFGKIVT